MAEQQVGPTAPAPAAAARPPYVLVVAAAALCQLLVVLDVSVVNVALPDLDRALDFSAGGLSWVVTAYTLAFGGLLLLGARVPDLLGLRRTLVVALAVLAVASLLGGIAQSPGQLVAARAVQGVAAAVLSPATLTLLTVSVPEGPRRSRALALWGIVATAGSALGVVLSGTLTQYAGWRWVFLVNLPLVLVAVALVLRAVRTDRSRPGARLDVPGAVLATGAMTSLTYACARSGDLGWTDATVLAGLAGAVLLAVGFVGWQRRAPAPLLRLEVLRRRTVAIATGLLAVIGVAIVAGFYFASLLLQHVLSYDPVVAGSAFLPFCLAMVVTTLASARLVEQRGARVVLAGGFALAGVGFAVLSLVRPDDGAAVFLVGSVLAALGLGLCIAPTLTLGTSGTRPEDAGMVSGLLNTSRHGGGSVGLAVLAAIAVRFGADGGDAASLADGYAAGFLVLAALLVAAAVAAYLLVPRAKVDA